MLGMPKTQVIFDLAGAIGGGDVKKTLQISGKLIADGLSPDSLVAAMVDHLRNLMILRAVGADNDMVEVPGLSDEELQQQAEQFDTVALSQDIAILEELRRSLRTSQAGRALLDATLVRLALADQFVSVAAMLDSNGAPTAGSGSASRPAPPALKKNDSPPPVAAAAIPSQSAEDDDDDDDLPRPGKVWDNSGPSVSELLKQREASNVEAVDRQDFDNVMSRLRSAVHDRSPAIDGFLMHGQFVGVEDGVAVIRYAHDHGAAALMLDRNGKKDVIQSELSQLLGEPVGVKFLVDAETVPSAAAKPPPALPVRREIRSTAAPVPQPPPRPVQPEVRITPELRDELKNANPLIRTLIDDLGAEIVKVE
jgi:DNA polymerase-3 subunit gamma/tau